MVTEAQKKLVQTTFATIAPIADDAALLFYQRLFEIAPELRPMFRGDMAEQRRKLMQMLALVVNGLNRPGAIVPGVRNLGRRHVAYGVKDHHYEAVRIALLWALGKTLGEAFTPEVEEAWTHAYDALAAMMHSNSA